MLSDPTWTRIVEALSTDGEIAQESAELGAAVFTHYWLTGLADTNGHAPVTFDESYAFAYGQALFRSARG